MPEKLTSIRTNLIMGFLSVGKTTAILDLLNQKPAKENWAVLVNEFGKVGIDGAVFAAAGATVKEVAGGCLCCAVAVPFQVSINRLLKEARPDRLLIEPTGLGHPKKVLDMLAGDAYKDVLDLRASVCLVDPLKLTDERYTKHENFVDQIVLSDVLVANKMDLANAQARELFYRWSEQNSPAKSMVAQTTQGQLDVAWLDIPRNPQRQALYPNAHQTAPFRPVVDEHAGLAYPAEGYQSFGYIFPVENCFDFELLNQVFMKHNVDRIKGIVSTNRGWLFFNGSGQAIDCTPTLPETGSRIEIITEHNTAVDFLSELNQCKVEIMKP